MMHIEDIISYYLLTFVLIFVSRTDACSMQVYEACDYAVTSDWLVWNLNGDGKYSSGTGDFENDVISSWKAKSEANEECAFYLCNGDETQPQYKCYYDFASNGETSELQCATSEGMNDIISNIIIREESSLAEVSLFSGDTLGGPYQTFGIGRYTLAQLLSRGVRNDDISSMKVVAAAKSKCHIELYEGDNFSTNYGIAIIPIPYNTQKTEHQFSLSTLENYGFKSNTLSSMVVSCVFECVA